MIFEKIKSELSCVISVGSYSHNSYKEEWSDIDFILVLDKINNKKQILISHESHILSEKLGKKISIDLVSTKDAVSPEFPLFLNTKILNGLYEASVYNEKIIYNPHSIVLYHPNIEIIKNYTQIAYRELFNEANKDFNRNMDIILLSKDYDYAKKYIKRLLNLIKFCVINTSLQLPNNKKEVIEYARKHFDEYDFTNYSVFIEIIENWENKNNYDFSKVMLLLATEIYKFNNYVFDKKLLAY